MNKRLSIHLRSLSRIDVVKGAPQEETSVELYFSPESLRRKIIIQQNIKFSIDSLQKHNSIFGELFGRLRLLCVGGSYEKSYKNTKIVISHIGNDEQMQDQDHPVKTSLASHFQFTTVSVVINSGYGISFHTI